MFFRVSWPEVRCGSYDNRVVRIVALGFLVMVCAAGCSTPARPTDALTETALPAAQEKLWTDISQIQSDDWFYLLNAGDEALQWRLRMIDSARVSVDMETFLWKPDSSGQQIVAHVLAAADRGVRVRFLLDDSFTMHEGLALHALDEHPNISLRLYNPFQHRSDSAVWRELFNAGDFARTNHRMHNKAMVVDGQVALVGGRNLADEYFGMHEEMNFRDMEVITAGSNVPQIVQHFDGFWNSGWAFPVDDVIDEPADAPDLDAYRRDLQLSVPSLTAETPEVLEQSWFDIAAVAFPGQAQFFFDQPASRDPARLDERPDQLAHELARVIGAAKSEVILVSAYLVPTEELEEVVERVEGRGVEVRILTNSLQSNNHLAAHAAYKKHVNQLIDHGADLHEVHTMAADRSLYMQHPVDEKQLGLHAKLLLIDDNIAFIGSCNLDPRSLEINTEVGLIINSEQLNQALRERLAIDFEKRNAWHVQYDDQGKLVWVGEEETLDHQPSDSAIQRLEDWFVGLLPIDKQM